MSDLIICPKCGHEYDISKPESWEVYDKDGKETEIDCIGCGKELIVTSHVTGWDFEVEINE